MPPSGTPAGTATSTTPCACLSPTDAWACTSARGVLDSTFFRFADELWWPHLIALSALNHYDLGQIEEGRAELARSVDLARDNRIVAFVQTVIAREHAGEAGRHRTP